MRALSKVVLVIIFTVISCRLSAESISGLYFPTSVAGTGGTGTTGYPYAVYVQIQNWTAAANSQAYLKIYNGSNNEFMWSASGQWSNATGYLNTNQPVVSIDAGGNWSGWIYAKHNDAATASVRLRGAKVGATGTQVTQLDYTPLTVLSMTSGGNGGWIFLPYSSAANKGLLAYSAGNVVGSYRSEDNGIAEGYPYGAGGFKIAVPAGIIDSLVAVSDDGSTFVSFKGPWAVTAGQETDASTSGADIGIGSATVAPPIVAANVSNSIRCAIFGQAPDTIRFAKVVVPASWTWSHSTGDIQVSGAGTPVAAVSGDTVSVENALVTEGDSLLVTLGGVIAPDTTLYFAFKVLTGATADSVFPIATQPSLLVYGTPMLIADAKQNDVSGVPLRNNTLITVRGIVTVADEFGGPSYIQDNSGGLGVYGSSFSTVVHEGDEVVVTGLVQPFNGLMEIVNPILHAIASTGNVVVPLTVTCGQVKHDGAGGVEAYEGLLVRLDGVSVSTSGVWGSNTNYPLTDGVDTTEVRIDNSTNLVGVPVPTSQFDLIGVVGQFISTSPYIGGYQILPRSTSDIISSGPIIITRPQESDITSTAMTVSWQTVNPGTSGVRYGATPALELGAIGDDTARTLHALRLMGLQPATVYYVQVFSASGTDTSIATPIIVSTASPPQTTGMINVYFNKSVQTSLAWYRPAQGNQDLLARALSRVNAAHRSIDAALYSLSGTVGASLASALISAKNRGVSVRVICEYDNSTTAPFSTLTSNGVPLITDRYDPVNAGAGLMHNKFLVIDGRGGAPDSMWVWTGSWNPTDPGTNDDYQNSIEIQDASLAGAYELEFNEMWGSATVVPNAAASRFGSRKTDNTPHRFVVGGREVESYFSPSDMTTSHILSAVSGARHSVAFALLSFTRNDLGDSVVGRKAAGLKVRGVLDNNTDQGNEYSFLLSGGVDVVLKSGTSGLFHHKYAVIDAEDPHWGSTTITGSHNWTNSAETSNNENTLIIHDGDVANQYLQEFAARYAQFGGTDTILVSADGTQHEVPVTYSISQNFPNPFNPSTRLRFSLPRASQVRLLVSDLLGRQVAILADGAMSAGVHDVEWNAAGCASGVYFVRFQAGPFSRNLKMVLMK